MSTPRRHFAGTEKVAILKRHLIDKVPVSNLCDELDLYPNQFYAWLKEFFENGHAAFDNGRKSKGHISDDGKTISRRNALKHGLRAEALALPNEDATVVAARNQSWNEYYDPQKEGHGSERKLTVK